MNDEITLIEQIRHGEAGKYRQLVEKYQVGLIIHCEQLMQDRSEAEDIAQDAFIKAYTQLHKFNGSKAQFSTWLYRIATNLAIDQLRKRRHTAAIENIDSIVAESAQSTLLSDEIDAVQRAVARLEPPVYAEIIKEYFWEGKSYQQIAAAHSTTTGTVGGWMSRAKEQLRKELA